MTDFPNMTPEELQASMQADLYRFMMEDCAGMTRDQISDALKSYLSDMRHHIEIVVDPLTDLHRRMRMSPPARFAPKTAWGWIKLLESLDTDAETRPNFTALPAANPDGSYTIRFDVE